jgi:site-specific recombinase XerD
MRGDIFMRRKRYSSFHSQKDFVFTEFCSRGPISDKTLRKMWIIIRAESGISDFGDFSYYCLRHTFATYRLLYDKIDVYTLSKIMGCSVQQIEYQYGNIKSGDMTDYITMREEIDGVSGY